MAVRQLKRYASWVQTVQEGSKEEKETGRNGGKTRMRFPLLPFYLTSFIHILGSLNPEDQRMHTHPPLNVTCPRRSPEEILAHTADLYR